MKRKIVDILIMIVVFILGVHVGLNIYDSRDVNRDKKINSQDYVMIKNYIMRGDK